jgi:hypothetical protein
MVNKDDIIIVETTDQMLMDAVHYAEKSLHYTFNQMGSGNLYDRVRNIVKGLIMEAAFKRLLDFHQVKYDLLGNTHWTKKDRYDVGIHGHKFDIKGFFISDGWKVDAINKDKCWLLDCSALVPSDQVNAKSLKDDDNYVFPFMTGEVIRDSTEGNNLFNQGRYKYLIHVFWGYGWFKNQYWKSLGKLTINSQMRSNLHIRIGGQGEDQELIIEEMDLKPKEKFQTQNQFYTVLFVQTNNDPSGDLLIKCETLKETERITPVSWGNIWFYDGLVYFTGYLSKGEFKKRSIEIPRFYKNCKQYGETKTINNMLLISELNPLTQLLPIHPQKIIPVISSGLVG